MKKITFHTILLLVVLTVLPSCSMMSESKKQFIKDLVNSSSSTERVLDIRDSETNSKLRRELIEKQSDLDEHISEWEQIKPQLTHAIALTQDLEFLLEQLEPSVSDAIPFIEDFSVSENDIVSTKAPKVNSDSFQSVELVAAKKPKFSTSNASFRGNESNAKNLANIDNKFASTSINRNTVAYDIENLKGSSKFTDTAKPKQTQQVKNMARSSDIVASVGNDECYLPVTTDIADGSQYALHIASYLKKENLENGLAQLQKQFASSFCGKAAVYKTVFVKGKEYLSLRLGPFNASEDAKKACASFNSKNAYCAVTKFDGEVL